MRKLACLTLFILSASAAMAQSTEPAKKTRRPDMPGTFVFELGVNRLTEKPLNLKYGFWGSRTANVYYQYDLRILKSKFSFHPGIGLGMERFKLLSYQQTFVIPPATTTSTFNYPYPTLGYDDQGNTAFILSKNYIYDGDTLNQPNWSNSLNIKKSMLAMTYLDVPLELRFSLKPEDPARSFKIAVGGRVGYLLGAHTKLRYRENGDIKKLKNNQDFNLSPFRYSVHMKIFFGNFAIFGTYNLNPLFKENKGPDQTQAQSYTVGLALHSF